jgi:formiminotetrahydrofolate cyclodeaminase
MGNQPNDRLENQETDRFISSVAAATPAPGGGSVAALAGALAAALGEMMAGLTEGREKFVSVEPQVREIHEKLINLRTCLQSLIQEDPAAYQLFMDAIRLPRKTDEEELIRDAAMEDAAKQATLTPLRTARAVSEILEYQSTLARIGNPNACCDLAVGAQLAFAVLKGMRYNILANTSGLKDGFFAEHARTEISDLIRKGREHLGQIERIAVHP